MIVIYIRHKYLQSRTGPWSFLESGMIQLFCSVTCLFWILLKIYWIAFGEEFNLLLPQAHFLWNENIPCFSKTHSTFIPASCIWPSKESWHCLAARAVVIAGTPELCSLFSHSTALLLDWGGVGKNSQHSLLVSCLHNWKVSPPKWCKVWADLTIFVLWGTCSVPCRHRAHFNCLCLLGLQIIGAYFTGSDAWKLCCWPCRLITVCLGLDPGCSHGQHSRAPGVQWVVS